MLVCIDKVTCVRMYNLIGQVLGRANSGTGEASCRRRPTSRRRSIASRQIEWMRETRMAVVVSEEQGEVEKFRKWELDITPHRRLMKEGMELPESMRRSRVSQHATHGAG